MIRQRNVEPSSIIAQRGRIDYAYYQGHGGSSTGTDAYHMSVQSLLGVAAGDTLANSSFYTKLAQSLQFTSANLDNNSTFQVNGRNQFDEPVSETISLSAGASSTAQTEFCYRRVTSIVCLTGPTFGADDTISIGYRPSTTTASNLTNEKFPLPWKAASTLDIKDIKWITGGTITAAHEHTYTVRLAPYWNVKITADGSGATASASITSIIRMYIDPDSPTV